MDIIICGINVFSDSEFHLWGWPDDKPPLDFVIACIESKAKSLDDPKKSELLQAAQNLKEQGSW